MVNSIVWEQNELIEKQKAALRDVRDNLTGDSK